MRPFGRPLCARVAPAPLHTAHGASFRPVSWSENVNESRGDISSLEEGTAGTEGSRTWGAGAGRESSPRTPLGLSE